MYRIIENDVRLLRRILVALNTDNKKAAKRVTQHLRKKGLKFILPKEQSVEKYELYAKDLSLQDRWLADTYGGIILPDYDGKGNSDMIFLNSKWINPYTLYVSLVDPVPELDELGERHWIPYQIGPESVFRPKAEQMHNQFLKGIRERILRAVTGTPR